MGKQKKIGLGQSLKSNIRNKTKKASDRHTTTAITRDYETLSSCTQENSLESFLRTADLANIDFTAEKLNVKVMTHHYSEAIPHPDVLKARKLAFAEHQRDIIIPRRPPWTKTMSKEELDRNEKDAFLEWRKSLAIVQENQHIVLTPFEKNLEIWRQLWRVAERSDIIIQIVDARNPLFYWCSDLELYVKELSESKSTIVLLNKSDLLSDIQRKCWAEYFYSCNISTVFYSAIDQLEKIIEEQEEECPEDEENEVSGLDEEEQQILANFNKFTILRSNAAAEEMDVPTVSAEPLSQPSTNANPETSPEPTVTSQIPDIPQPTPSPLKQTENEQDSPPTGPCQDTKMDSAENTEISSTENTEMETSEDDQRSEGEIIMDKIRAGDVLHNSELLTYFTMLREDESYTIGLVGYPNVGKSSTLNSVLQEKRVQVSATPGKTKHFQTFQLDVNDKKIVLCDCPGLVFPNMANSKSEMLCNGVLPVDHMRDNVGPMTHLINTIPRIVLESVYGITLPTPDVLENNRLPYPHEVLREYGAVRGFMTTRGTPDESRAARIMLKDYVNGKLLYVKPPPTYTGDDFNPICEKYMNRVVKSAVMLKKTNVTLKKETVENIFFKAPEPKLLAKGRPPGATPPGATPAGAEPGTEPPAGGKPWKKHYKGKSKEKTRRKTLDLVY